MVTMTEIMRSARESVASIKKEEGATPKKVAVHLEFDPTALDYDLGDLCINGTDLYADDPEYCVDLYLYLAPYSNVQSRTDKAKAKRRCA